MRKILLTFFAAILCAASMWADVAVNGKLPGAFSVSATKQVWFSQGNLQATTSDLGEHWTWNFAENQWDFLGQTSPNNYLTGNGTVSENGSVDLFRWSSSKTYYGINTSTEVMDYVGDFVDWGTNAITNGGNQANIWRTPTKDEWEYLINTRTTTSGARYAVAKVNDKKGLILLPDDWNTSYYALSDINTAEDVACSSNTISSTDWTNILEAHGAVFLPGAGMRLGISSVSGVGDCYYMSSTSESSYYMGYLEFFEQFSVRVSSYPITNGLSVRLVSETAPVPPTMEETPLTFEAMEAGAQVTYNANSDRPVQYSTDGTTWTDYSEAITLTNIGDKVSFRGNNAAYNTMGVKFQCSADCYIYGNVMSLVSPSGYATATTLSGSDNFSYLFLNNTHIKNHSSKDLVLPATTLANSCYYHMFNGCSGLTRAPELPATTLAGSCYSNMFKGCTSLVSAPELPATTLANFCYSSMFYGCTGLTSAPELPATTLTEECYRSMFQGCTYLTSAPELPATALTDYCYAYMFSGCYNLSTVTCYATTTTSNATYNWLNGVAASGTFYAPTNGVLNNEARGVSAIPSGWNVAFLMTGNEDPDHAGDYYSTFFDSSIKYTMPAGVEAYVAELSDDALNLTKIAEEGEVLPANTAVILKSTVANYTLMPTTDAPITVTAINNLHGVDAETEIATVVTSGTCYVLSGGSNGVGFYTYSAPNKLKAHKAYAVIDAGIAYAPKKLRFVFNQEQTATGIEGIQPSDVRSQKIIRDGQLIIIRNGVEYNANGQVVK